MAILCWVISAMAASTSVSGVMTIAGALIARLTGQSRIWAPCSRRR